MPLRGSISAPFQDTKGARSPSSPAEEGQFAKTETEMEQVENQIRGLYEKLSGAAMNSDDAKVVRTERGYKIRLGEVVLFRPGSDRIKREGIPFLFELGKRLIRLNAPVQIEGHADSMPGAEFNSHWELSASRAFHVVQFMVEGVKFPPDHLSLVGYGDTQPIASNESPEGRARNRRVEISITTTKDIAELEW